MSQHILITIYAIRRVTIIWFQPSYITTLLCLIGRVAVDSSLHIVPISFLGAQSFYVYRDIIIIFCGNISPLMPATQLFNCISDNNHYTVLSAEKLLPKTTSTTVAFFIYLGRRSNRQMYQWTVCFLISSRTRSFPCYSSCLYYVYNGSSHTLTTTEIITIEGAILQIMNYTACWNAVVYQGPRPRCQEKRIMLTRFLHRLQSL